MIQSIIKDYIYKKIGGENESVFSRFFVPLNSKNKIFENEKNVLLCITITTTTTKILESRHDKKYVVISLGNYYPYYDYYYISTHTHTLSYNTFPPPI